MDTDKHRSDNLCSSVVPNLSMKRREFIILGGIGATSASLLSACGHPEEKLIPVFIPDDEYIPGIDYWKASTCGMCQAGCGIIVRTREHKANKIEGNPLHPVNRGALCARGQAGLEVLYNPDRIKGPMKRVGERGEGKWEEISWDEGIKTLADKLREIGPRDRAYKTAFLTNDQMGMTAHGAARFMEAYGSGAWVAFPSFDEADPDISKVFDIANATYLLSFGARFLETWKSPVMYSLAYGEFRRSSGKARGKFVQVEPRMSLTGANADEWVPAAADSEAIVALALAQVIVREGLARRSPSPELAASLERYAPEKTAERAGISTETLVRIAREFSRSERPLALGGSTKTNSLRWVDFLNMLVDNTNKKGGVLLPVSGYLDLFEKLRPRFDDRIGGIYASRFPDMLGAKELAVLMVHQFDPVSSAPSERQRIKEIPFLASFSSFRDETTELADLVLPDHSYLESWDLREIRRTTEGALITLTQPIIKPEFNSMQTVDVLIALSREFGGAVAESIPFQSAEEIVKQSFADLPKAGGSIKAETADGFWTTLAERGVWIGKPETTFREPSKPEASSLPQPGELDRPRPFGTRDVMSDQFPLALLNYEHAALGNGTFANLPALQELPDPMTSVMWGSWVEINPKTARSLGIADGDLVEVSTEHGSVRVPAVLYPAIRPDVIAMPYGQGHTGYARYATNRGANPAVLNPGLQGTVSAKISKVAGKATLIRFGTDLQQLMEKKTWR
jgi:menaquinone reductase, molybdopterin-binding-like subunit